MNKCKMNAVLLMNYHCCSLQRYLWWLNKEERRSSKDFDDSSNERSYSYIELTLVLNWRIKERSMENYCPSFCIYLCFYFNFASIFFFIFLFISFKYLFSLSKIEIFSSSYFILFWQKEETDEISAELSLSIIWRKSLSISCWKLEIYWNELYLFERSWTTEERFLSAI